MAHGNPTDEELASLIRRTAEGTAAYIRGEIRRSLALIPHADDFTLMAPYGGEPMRGVDASDEVLDALERFFQGGEAELDVVQTHASGDLAVLVAIERQHGRVGGLPDQDWSLRVTLVFRRDEAVSGARPRLTTVARGVLQRTPYTRSSENSPSTHLGD
jgi:ketosteroid isomerase-like protein